MSTPIHSYLIDGCIKCWQFTSPFFESKWISLSIFSKKPQNTKLTYLTTSCYTSSLCETWALWLGSDTSTEDILHSCHASPFQRAVSLTRAKIRPVPNPHRGGEVAPVVCFNAADQVLDWSQRQSHGLLCWSQPAFLVLPPPNCKMERRWKTCKLGTPPGATRQFPSKRRHLPCKNKWNMSNKDNWTTLHRSRVPGQCAPGGQRSFDSMTLR